MLGHTKRVLMIGAHPDDEDTELLTILVRGMGTEAAYLSLNRGEGGQNLIGPELGEALSLLRTEELLAARRLDGARQYFTRAYDFGFSKSLAETWTHWPRDTVLKDVVRMVRRFRPQVIVSIFSGTPRDGHGQHQAAGWATREAFRVAGDPAAFPELGREEHLAPWVPLKLYRSARFDTAATTLTLAGGVLDPVVGKSYHQIAMAGRSLHRSQDMGRLQEIGPSPVRLALVEDRTTSGWIGGGAGGGALFSGIDTTPPWSGPALRLLDTARSLLARGRRDQAAELLARMGEALEPAPGHSGSSSRTMTAERADQLDHLQRARAGLSGLVPDALADDDRLVPGQRLGAKLLLWNGGDERRLARAELAGPEGWEIGVDSAGPTWLPAGAVLQRAVTAGVPEDAPLTTPYFLRRPRQGAMYDWSGVAPAVRGEPFEPPRLTALFRTRGGVAEARELTYRYNDQARGEVRRPVTIVPRVGVQLEPATEVWSTLSSSPHRLSVTLTHGARDTTGGTVRLEVPAGWLAPSPQAFRLVRAEERETFVFTLRPPPGRIVGEVEVRAVATDERGRRYDVGVVTVDHPHIRPRSYVTAARATIRTVPIALPRLARVGYVRGAADRVPEALAAVGFPVAVLDSATLADGDLRRYDAIVVGPRAYETDPALVENNARLLNYVRRGGLLIVQYQQQAFFREGYAPYPLVVGGPAADPALPPVAHDRVTDETAPVRLLAPADPVVRRPNRIGPPDWSGWVQERGLYFARSWDPAYRPVLETSDPGEAPLAGGLLVASVGQGTYVYTGLSFFRQLPAGVPGAFRLFANLLTLGAPASRRPASR